MDAHLLDLVATVRVKNSVAAGTTAQSGATVDLQAYGADACRAVALIGTLTETQVTALSVQASNDDGSTDAYADITGSKTGNMADGDSNKLLISDVIRPLKRYVQAKVYRGTANAVIDGVLMELYRLRTTPAPADSTVSQQAKAVSGSA